MLQPSAFENIPEFSGNTEPADGAFAVPGSFDRFVAFHLGSGLYGVPAERVAEVSRPLELTPLPYSPAGLLGIAGFRDEIVAVVDLRSAIEETPAEPEARTKLVILNAAANETRIAFLVDKMFEIVSAPSGPFDGNELIAASAELDTGELKILDTENLRLLLT